MVNQLIPNYKKQAVVLESAMGIKLKENQLW
jgi:hypothetical protein